MSAANQEMLYPCHSYVSNDMVVKQKVWNTFFALVIDTVLLSVKEFSQNHIAKFAKISNNQEVLTYF